MVLNTFTAQGSTRAQMVSIKCIWFTTKKVGTRPPLNIIVNTKIHM